MMIDERHQEQGRPEDAPSAKKPYSKPELVEFGDVRELTRGGGFSVSDFLTTRRHKTA